MKCDSAIGQHYIINPEWAKNIQIVILGLLRKEDHPFTYRKSSNWPPLEIAPPSN